MFTVFRLTRLRLRGQFSMNNTSNLKFHLLEMAPTTKQERNYFFSSCPENNSAVVEENKIYSKIEINNQTATIFLGSSVKYLIII